MDTVQAMNDAAIRLLGRLFRSERLTPGERSLIDYTIGVLREDSQEH